MSEVAVPREVLDEAAEELFAELHLVSTTQWHKGQSSDEIIALNPRDVTTNIFTSGLRVFGRDASATTPVESFLKDLNEFNEEANRLNDDSLWYLTLAVGSLWAELRNRQEWRERQRGDWGDTYRQIGADLASEMRSEIHAVPNPVPNDSLPGLAVIRFEDSSKNEFNPSEFVESMFYFDEEERLSDDPVLRRWQLEDAFVAFTIPLIHLDTQRGAE